MLGLWIENRHLTLRRDLPMPEPSLEDALIKVRMAGICGTDLELLRGYLPFCGIPGHELVGEVVEAPSAPGLEGARVVCEINIACGACEHCRAGLERHCTRRRVLGLRDCHGAFAEYLLAPVSSLHRVPDSVPDEAAVLTEPLAAARAVLDQVEVQRGARVLVIGAGRLGQLLARVLATTGCDLHVVARHTSQRRLLAPTGANVLEETGLQETLHHSPGSFDVVVEASGSASALDLAIGATRPRGTVVLKTTITAPVELDLARTVVNELRLVGSRCGPFGPALEILEAGSFDPQLLITDRLPLTEGIAAFHRAATPGVGKVVLIPPGA